MRAKQARQRASDLLRNVAMNSSDEVGTDAHPEAHPNGRVHGPCPDCELVSMARDGDEVAFEELLKRNYQSSIRLASMILRGRPEAEDAVLQAAYKAYAGLHGFENRSKFSSWINQIV